VTPTTPCGRRPYPPTGYRPLNALVPSLRVDPFALGERRFLNLLDQGSEATQPESPADASESEGDLPDRLVRHSANRAHTDAESGLDLGELVRSTMILCLGG
jgi:hypothetical protein